MDHVLISKKDRILHIQFNRPQKKNALTLAMYTEMSKAIQQAEADPQTRVIFFCGSDDCFTSGNDIADFLSQPPTGESSPVVVFLKELIQAKKPIVAAVNGFAIGIGTTMLLHCDLVYAGEDACFQMPFANLGLCPEAGSSFLLPQLAGHQRASELLLLGETFNANIAHQLGIVNAVYAKGEFQQKALQKAQKIVAQPPNAIRTTKALLKRARIQEIEAARKAENEKFLPLLHGPEAKEAMTAFMEKRPADFSRFE